MNPIMQDDFGGFTPRFPGITLKFQSPQAWAAFEGLIKGAPIVGATDLVTSSIASVLDHERRHYHDFLISPYGSLAVRMQLQAAVNGFLVLGWIQRRPERFVPASLELWSAMAEAERIRQIAEWRAALGLGDGAPLSLTPIPQIDAASPVDAVEGVTTIELAEDSLTKPLHAAARAYRYIRNLARGSIQIPSMPDITPCNFFEAIALAAQTQAIVENQSQQAAQAFLAFLDQSELPYARLWRRLWQLAARMPQPFLRGRPLLGHIDQVAVIASWCVLGNPLTDELRACPNARFLKLDYYLQTAKLGPADSALDVAATWSHWDAVTGMPEWRSEIEQMVASNERQLEVYRANRRSDGMLEYAITSFERYVTDQRALLRLFLKRPEAFLHLQGYVTADYDGGVPEPLIRVQLRGFSWTLPNTRRFHSLWDDGPGAPVSAFVIADEERRDEVNAAAVFERMIHACDLLIANQAPSRSVDDATYLDAAAFTGKRPLWIV